MIIVRKLFLSLLASLVLGFATTNIAFAADETAEALIERISQEVLDAAKSDKAIQSGKEEKILDLVEKKILPYIDFPKMTESAAANNWKLATPQQKQELVKQFKSLLVYTYSGALSQVKDQTMKYERPRMSGDDVIVRSKVISPRSGPIQLEYRLSKEADGWKIVDMNVLGVWLIETYKGQFRTKIDGSGIDGLITFLTKRNAELATTFTKKSS